MRSRWGLRGAALVGLVGILGLFGPAQLSSGQTLEAPLTVVKVVTGTAPAGTVFTVTISCNPASILEGPNHGQATMTFNATGQPQGSNTIGFTDQTTCTVTETVTGGATTVVYTCTSNPGGVSVSPFPDAGQAKTTVTTDPPPTPGCAAAGPQSTPMTVNIVNTNQSATVTVTNTFVPPPPPAPLAVAAFTG